MKKILTLSLIVIYCLLIGVDPVLAVKCLDEKPNKAPELFQIDATRSSAKLYFTPVNNAVTGYTIVYGYERLKNDFGVSFPYGMYDGVIYYTVNDLSPNTKYYFRVRADNGCRQGFYSDTMSIQTNWDFKTYTLEKDSSVLGIDSAKPISLPKRLLKVESPDMVAGNLPTERPTLPLEQPIVEKKQFNFFDFISSIFSIFLQITRLK